MSDRSASPAREEPQPKKQKTSGFKWKEKRAEREEKADARDTGRLERGYRNRSPKRDGYRDRSPRRDKHEDRVRDEERRGHGDSYRPRDRDSDRKDDDRNLTCTPKAVDQPAEKPKKKKDKPPKPSSQPSGPIIVVNINDRLGTKAAIPCMASDSIKAFKAVVAAHIGRQPHEIMLKRQGERPFKDQLTLEDYGVSNGVQLDLELDTGD